QLDRKLVAAGITVADQFLATSVEVLFTALEALDECQGRGAIEDFHAGPRPFIDLDAVTAGVFIGATGGNRPTLARWQRIAADAALAVQFRGDDKCLVTFRAEMVAEVRVAELGRTDPFLLFLHTPPTFQGKADRPFQVFIGYLDLGIRLEQLEQAADW